MMSLDLKFLIIPVMPFVFLGFLRLMWFAAGAEWVDRAFAAVISTFLGLFLGFIIVTAMENAHVKWTLRLGSKE